MDQLNQQRDLIQSLMSDRKKVGHKNQVIVTICPF